MAFIKKLKNPHVWPSIILVMFLVGMSTGVFGQSANVYGERGAQVRSGVQQGTILQVRMVKVEVDSTTRNAATAVGGALAGGVGAHLGRRNNAVATALAVAAGGFGAIAGRELATAWGGTPAREYVIRMAGGAIIAVTQPEPGEDLRAGEEVFVIDTQGTQRVVRIQNYVQQPAATHPVVATPQPRLEASYVLLP